MKIDEPKTPYAKRYDPSEDIDDDGELTMLDAGEIKVDELENGKKGFGSKVDSEIPELELGEGVWSKEEQEREEQAERDRRARSHSPKVVHVAEDAEKEEEETEDELAEKHRKFEELRKRHYEMRDVANLLGHPEIVDEEDEDENDGDEKMEDAPNGVPPVPKVPNGDQS